MVVHRTSWTLFIRRTHIQTPLFVVDALMRKIHAHKGSALDCKCYLSYAKLWETYTSFDITHHIFYKPNYAHERFEHAH